MLQNEHLRTTQTKFRIKTAPRIMPVLFFFGLRKTLVIARRIRLLYWGCRFGTRLEKDAMNN